MNCASLEVMAADLVWIEEETTHTGIAVFAIWLIVSVAIVAIVTLLVRRWQKRQTTVTSLRVDPAIKRTQSASAALIISALSTLFLSSSHPIS